MSNGINKVILVGTAGQDPEMKTFPNGGRILTFSIATNQSWLDKDNNRQTLTDWHRIVLSNGTADYVARHLKKGHKIYVEGKLRTRQWTDQNGIERYTTEIRGETVELFQFSQNNQQVNQAPAAPQANSYGPNSPRQQNLPIQNNSAEDLDLDDDLPF